MKDRNGSSVKEFILVGFPGSLELKTFLFMLFFIMYLLTVSGNVAIIALVKISKRLHTPMYFFLCNLSFLEIWYTTGAVPKTLANLLSQDHSISFIGCIIQMYVVYSLGCTEFFLLAVMAYDRYLAICYPLHYNTIMSKTLSIQMALGSWVCGFLAIILPTFLVTRLSFCDSNVINHFFCNIEPLIDLSCTDTCTINIVWFIIAFTAIMSSCVTTLISYVYIITTILKISSAQGRQKAFSTCSSHLTVVLIWYGSSFMLHVKSPKQNSIDLTKIVAVFKTLVTPILNPFIYTLRNTEVKEALRSTFRRSTVSLFDRK